MTIHTTKDGVTLLVDLPEKKRVEYTQPSLVKACRGNARVAEVLDSFVYGASREAKEKGLKGCKVVTVTRTHDKIMQNLQRPPSRKTLIRYLDLLNEWKLVLSQPYQRDFIVDLEAIQQAINNPPQVAPPVKRLHEKGCRSTTFAQKTTTFSPDELDYEKVVRLYMEMAEKVTTLEVEHAKKVEELQQKVVDLHKKVEELQLKVVMLQPFDPASSVSTPDSKGAKNEPPIYTYNNLYITNKEESDASASSSPTPDKNFTVPHEKLAPTGEPHGHAHSTSEPRSQSVQPVPPAHQSRVDRSRAQNGQDHPYGDVCPDVRNRETSATESAGGPNAGATSEQITPPAYSRTIPPTEKKDGERTNASAHPDARVHDSNIMGDMRSAHHAGSSAGVDVSASGQYGEVSQTALGGVPPTTVAQERASQRRAAGAGGKGGVTPSRSVAKKARNQITLQGQHILDLYQELRGRRITSNDGNIRAANGLGDVVESDEDFREVYQEIQDDPFLNRNNVTRDLDFLYRKYDGYFDRVVKRRKAALRIVSSQSCESMEAAKERARVNNLAAMEKLQAMKAKKLAATRGA